MYTWIYHNLSDVKCKFNLFISLKFVIYNKITNSNHIGILLYTYFKTLPYNKITVILSYELKLKKQYKHCGQ